MITDKIDERSFEVLLINYGVMLANKLPTAFTSFVINEGTKLVNRLKTNDLKRDQDIGHRINWKKLYLSEFIYPV